MHSTIGKYRNGIACFIFIVLMNMSVYPVYGQSGDITQFERAKASFKKGFVYFNTMRYLGAVEFFRKALSIYPDYHTAREYLARSYRLAGFKDEALEEWENLHSQNPDNVLVLTKIDTLRYRRGNEVKDFSADEFRLSDEVISKRLKQYRFPGPVDITQDDNRNIFITSFSSGKLVKIDPNKQGLSVMSPGVNSRLYGIDYRNKRLIVSDFKQDVVYLMNTIPRITSSFGKSGSGDGEFHGPQGVCFNSSDYMYVVDSGNNRVQKFDPDGKFVLKFGSLGEYEGQFRNPTDCVSRGNRIYVTDTGNKRISCFDDSGNFIRDYRPENAELPRGITERDNNLIVSDEKNGLLFFDLNSERTVSFRSWDNNKGRFFKLYSAFLGSDRFLYCLDHSSERVFIFSPLQRYYSNIDVEISQIDVKKFPITALYLHIKDKNGKPVYGLTRENFTVTEDGAKIFGLYTDYLKRRYASASMVLCVDRSKAMSRYHNDIPWTAEFILKKMRRNDSLKIIGFNEDYWTENKFDWSRRRALRALKKRKYGSGKNIGRVLYNAISDLLAKTDRRGVVLVTDGKLNENSFGRYSADIIIDYAKSHFIPIMIISFSGRHPILEKIATETGGELFTVKQVDGLRSIYDRVRNSEEYRYVIVYSSYKRKSMKGWWADIKIDVDMRGQKGIEWGGYFVP